MLVKNRYTNETIGKFEIHNGANLSRANLRGANLSGANLIGANLSGANLSRTDLSGANLSGANLRGANLRGANLSRTDLIGANLSGANLSGANLSGANLIGANLRGANLSRTDLIGANLSGANLIGANLRGAKNDEYAIAITSIMPDEGDVIGFKKCINEVIVKLLVSAGTRRSNSTGRKCRAESAIVLEVIGADIGISQYDKTTEYRIGQLVTCDKWNEDRWVECGGGIHFFITRFEAEHYS